MLLAQKREGGREGGERKRGEREGGRYVHQFEALLSRCIRMPTNIIGLELYITIIE